MIFRLKWLRQTIVAMRLSRVMSIALLLTGVSIVSVGVAAQDLLAGTWKIASSEPAPWPHDATWEVPAEINHLVGATVILRADRIDGPKPLACKAPRYKVEQYSVDMLFQGTLAEKGDTRTTPDKAETALGFTKRPIPSLTTSCASEIEFHIIDADHMLFALNNRVYRMQRAAVNAKTAASAKSKP